MQAGTDLSTLVARPGPVSMPYLDAAFPDRPLLLHGACPAGWHAAMPVLFVHHGVARNGRDYRDYWLPHSRNMLVLAIEFPESSFPEYLCYNFGNLHGPDGSARPRQDWTFGIGPRLFERLRAEGICTASRYALFGHSAGGQYVHRMLSFGYRDNVAAAITANAGTYAMPDRSIEWPWGLGGVPADELAAILGFPLTIMAGTEDTRTTGRHFPKGPKSLRQGANRFERAHAYWHAGVAAAQRLGIHCAWRLIEVPGIGHDGRGMSDAAAAVIAEALRPK